MLAGTETNNDEYMQLESDVLEPDLMDPDIWIADTGAMAHGMAHQMGVTNIRTASPMDDVLGVTGPPARANKIVDIPYILTKADRTKKTMVLKDVTHVSEG